MKSVYNIKENCCGCAACKQVCPTNSIYMKEDENGYLYPYIDGSRCVDCLACRKVCPFLNTRTLTIPQITCAYVNPDEEYRMQSASSGAFEALCKAFIQEKENYSIYGCELDDKLHAHHCSIHNITDIDRMKKSKYLQSYIENEYVNILTELRMSKTVIFSGTPCQVAALKNYLKKDFENLLTIDFVCHGVPSQKIFLKYIQYLEKKYHGKVQVYKFRNKRKTKDGWTNLGTCFYFVDGRKIELEVEEDLYMNGFLYGLFNRDSCYKCKFASLNRVSDITVGDFWGIERVYPELTELKTNGTSLIMGNTSKGISTIKKLDEKTLYFTNLEDAIIDNGQLKNPQSKNVKRDVFLREFRRNKKFDVCIKRAFPEKYGFTKQKIYRMKPYIVMHKFKYYIMRLLKII